MRFDHAAIVLLATLLVYQTARAQDPLHIPSGELSIPGVAQKPTIGAPTIDSSGFQQLLERWQNGQLRANALATQFQEEIHFKDPRQATALHDVALFREVAPSVVLIRTKDESGTGSLLKDNVILTSLHVVDHNREVTIIFKPADPNGFPTPNEVVAGDVKKIDIQRDLALVRPRSVPNRRPLEISPGDIEVGADVHAIGHPLGRDWTYTKGIVSSIRPDFEWTYGQGDTHRGTIIQTQTPIYPGNSGGPLLSDDGKIVGVNAFVTKGADGLNFAVAAKEIRYFLQNPAEGMDPSKPCSQAKVVFEGRNKPSQTYLKFQDWPI
jgi:S1-C subfamily serine protease